MPNRINTSPATPTTPPNTTGPAFTFYTVKPGDTLSGIAKNQLGAATKWRDIADANKDVLPDPNKLQVGMKLKLPRVASPPNTQPSTPTQPTNNTTDGWKPPPSTELQGLFYGDKFDHKVALTFDDGPDAKNTPKVLDILKRHKVKATFFVCGNHVRENPELVRRLVAEGHTLGNHSWDHANLSKLDQAKIEKEFKDTQAAVDKALGYHYELTQVRPPYGATSPEVKNAIKKGGDVAVMWNVDSNDWKYPKDDQAILDNVFKGANSIYARGGVILFHDIHPQASRVLDQVIDRLQSEGYQFVKTDRLLEQKYFKPS